MLSKLLRIGEGRMVKRLRRVADYVDTLSGDVESLTDAELRAKTDVFRQRVADGETLDDLLPEAFAVAREAAWRVLIQRPFQSCVRNGGQITLALVWQFGAPRPLGEKALQPCDCRPQPLRWQYKYHPPELGRSCRLHEGPLPEIRH